MTRVHPEAEATQSRHRDQSINSRSTEAAVGSPPTRWRSMDELYRGPAKRGERWWPRLEDDVGLITERERRLWAPGEYRLDPNQRDRQLKTIEYRLTPWNNMWIRQGWEQEDKQQQQRRQDHQHGTESDKTATGLYAIHEYKVQEQRRRPVNENIQARTFELFPEYDLSYINCYGFMHSIDRPGHIPRRTVRPWSAQDVRHSRPSTDIPPMRRSETVHLGMIQPAAVIENGPLKRRGEHAIRKLPNGLFVYDQTYVYDNVHEYRYAREYAPTGNERRPQASQPTPSKPAPAPKPKPVTPKSPIVAVAAVPPATVTEESESETNETPRSERSIPLAAAAVIANPRPRSELTDVEEPSPSPDESVRSPSPSPAEPVAAAAVVGSSNNSRPRSKSPVPSRSPSPRPPAAVVVPAVHAADSRTSQPKSQPKAVEEPSRDGRKPIALSTIVRSMAMFRT